MSKYSIFSLFYAVFFVFFVQNEGIAQAKLVYQPISIAAFSDVAIAAPTEKSLPEPAKNITHRDSAFIKYWQWSGVIRWNMYVRELVGAYNVAPVLERSTQSYPVPDPKKPADLPRYPYCNPPYASRVFAYTSVAQFDALATAQYYQAKFARPSYPASEAASAVALTEVLKSLFPAEVQAIGEKLADFKHYTLLSGACSENDWNAGANIGTSIAEKVIAMSEKDGMKAAMEMPRYDWRNIEKAIREKKEIAWESRQKPARPPYDPYFGTVKRWFGGDMATLRPTPPLSTHSLELKKQFQVMKDSARLFDDHKTFTVGRWSDGDLSPTPIGHWNALACNMMQEKKTLELDKAYQLAWLNRAMMDAAIVIWDAKYFYFYPRPPQLDSSVQTKLNVPNFPSYPSGHSAFSMTAAKILSHFYPTEANKLRFLAHEASISRVFAGLHYPMDCTAGESIGEKIWEMIVPQLKKESK